MPVPAQIEQLVDRFHRRRAEYRRADYNETQARRELIDPLFEALGWDVAHRLVYELYELMEEEIAIVELNS
jgi:hypothetical protein